MTKSKGLTHVSTSIELYQLPLRGAYEMAIVGLIHSFKDKGLMMSNGKLATALYTHERTIERVISRLKTNGVIHDIGTGRNDRCLVLTPDTMSVLGTRHDVGKDPTSRGARPDMTADHKLKKLKEVNRKDLALSESEHPGPAEDEILAALEELPNRS